MAIVKKADPVAYAAKGDDVSYWRTLNPFSQLFGGGDRYPEWWGKWFFPENPTLAGQTFKTAAIGTLALITAAALRGASHNNAMTATYETDDPSRKLKSHLGTAFVSQLAPYEDPKKAKKVKKQSDLSKKAFEEPQTIPGRPDATPLPGAGDIVTNAVRTAIPLASLVLMASAGWRTADVLSDKHRNKQLTKQIADKSNVVRQLMQTRARLAKGVATEEELNAASEAAASGERAYVKTAAQEQKPQSAMTTVQDFIDNASAVIRNGVKTAPKKPAPGQNDPHPFWRGVLGSYGLLVLALGIASGVGAYKYFSASDPNNIKFKALKKGLRTYAREKTSMTPITNVPSDTSEYFAAIDEGGKDKNVREEPEKQAINRGVVISD